MIVDFIEPGERSLHLSHLSNWSWVASIKFILVPLCRFQSEICTVRLRRRQSCLLIKTPKRDARTWIVSLRTRNVSAKYSRSAATVAINYTIPSSLALIAFKCLTKWRFLAAFLVIPNLNLIITFLIIGKGTLIYVYWQKHFRKSITVLAHQFRENEKQFKI